MRRALFYLLYAGFLITYSVIMFSAPARQSLLPIVLGISFLGLLTWCAVFVKVEAGLCRGALVTLIILICAGFLIGGR